MPPNEIRLGKYILQRKLGEGNYAEVWLAQDVSLERPVALKLLKPIWMTDAEARVRFLREARVLANLHHPRIAWVWELGEEHGRAFIAMRYVDGVSLDRLIQQKGRMEWDEALRIVAEAGEGLEFAHRKELVHRDIKPQNILVSAEEGVVLTDFGLVRALEGSEAATRTHVIMGTPYYMAPEIWDGQPSGPGADQYALACVLVEMLTGRPLFEAPNSSAIMKKHFQPVQLPADLPAARRAALLKALSEKPEERWSGLGEWIQALRVVSTAVQKPEKFAFEPRMVRIPDGEFLMGLTKKNWIERLFSDIEPEQAQHKVLLTEYKIGKYPITCREYQAFVQDSQYRAPWDWFGNQYPAGKAEHPVVNVSWVDAQSYCAWLSQKTGKRYRLPSEAEWEKAARGTDGRMYPWGNQVEAGRANCTSPVGTTPVGQFSPQGDSPYGCVDMAGNVWEWVNDWYDPSYYRSSPANNPTGR